EGLQPRRIGDEAVRHLPQDRSGLFPERRAARIEKRKTMFRVLQLVEMRDQPRALDGEDDALGRARRPAREGFRLLQAVERRIDLDAAEMPDVMLEPEAGGNLARVEDAAPLLVAPP